MKEIIINTIITVIYCIYYVFKAIPDYFFYVASCELIPTFRAIWNIAGYAAYVFEMIFIFYLTALLVKGLIKLITLPYVIAFDLGNKFANRKNNKRRTKKARSKKAKGKKATKKHRDYYSEAYYNNFNTEL